MDIRVSIQVRIVSFEYIFWVLKLARLDIINLCVSFELDHPV